jgi:hypothetical protein
LSVTDFYIVEDGAGIAAAGALWDQRTYQQYIALDYKGVYKLAAALGPLLRLFRYPPLPAKGEAADFAYAAFLMGRGDVGNGALRVLLAGLAIAVRSRGYGFVAVGAADGDELSSLLSGVRGIRLGSRLCVIDYKRNSALPVSGTPLRFECGLL